MPKLTVAGHSLHTLTGRPAFAWAAHYGLVGANAGAVAAAISGAADYLALPSGTHTKKTANMHATVNSAALGLAVASQYLRAARPESPGAGSKATSAATMLLLFSGAWYGGHLVYEHGVRVRKARPLEHADEVHLPGDRALERAFETAQKHAPLPETGPEDPAGRP